MKLIQRPIDPYSQDWPVYWAQNPQLRRGVGADAADGDGSGDNDGSDNEPDIETLKREAAEAKRLREENERLTAKSREADKHKKEQERLARENAEKASLAAGDLESYKKSVDEKISGITQEIGTERDLYRSIAEKRTSGAAAISLANRLAMPGEAEAILPHIAGRIGVKVVGDDMVPVVLDENGRETALTMDDLEKEIRKIPFLKRFIVASSASGAGLPGGQGGNNNKLKTREEVERMSAVDQGAYFRSVAKEPKKYSD
jgi:hypothetical protein